MSTTNETGLNMVTDLINAFMSDDVSVKFAAKDDKDTDKDEKKDKSDDEKDKSDESDDKDDKKDKSDDKDDKKGGFPFAKKASVADLLQDIGALPTELQKLAAAAHESRQRREAKEAEASKVASENAPEATMIEKLASGELSDKAFFNEIFYEETAKLASQYPQYAGILAEKLAQAAE